MVAPLYACPLRSTTRMFHKPSRFVLLPLFSLAAGPGPGQAQSAVAMPPVMSMLAPRPLPRIRSRRRPRRWPPPWVTGSPPPDSRQSHRRAGHPQPSRRRKLLHYHQGHVPPWHMWAYAGAVVAATKPSTASAVKTLRMRRWFMASLPVACSLRLV